MEKVIVSNNRIHKFDTVGNRFEFYYDEGNDSFFVFDNVLKIKTDLEIKYRKYNEYKEVKELPQIRYWFPKPHNLDKKVYYKSISDIKFQLFGELKDNSGSPISLTIEKCKDIIKKNIDENGIFNYTDMFNSDNVIRRKVYTFIRDNGGSSKFIEIINELGYNYENYYTDGENTFFKSSYEFTFFSILHHNNIKFEYEPFNVKNYKPDFYIQSKKYLIEILGISTREFYNIKSEKKEKLYKSEGYNYKPIVVDRHHPTQSIFKNCENIFGKLKEPNYNFYRKKYILTSEQFIKQLKIYLTEINSGELKVSVRKDKSGFREKYRKYYEYVISNYGTVQMGIKELVGIPSTKFKSVKIEKYWKNIDYVKEELENVYKIEKRIPTKYECRIKYRSKYNLWNFYRFWGEESILEGGKFYDFIEELKLKYGKRDLSKENDLKKENDISKKVQLVIDGKIPTKGKNSFRKKYRWINEYLQKVYGGLFFYIKSKIGYPPPHILRPNGYYQIEDNVKYELEENWKIYKRIPSYSERLGSKGKENTFNNMIGILGVNSFKKGGKYFKFIETLKVKYGYDDTVEKSEIDFEKKVFIYLKGINDGKWNTKTISSKELGIHKGYFSYVYKKYGNVFLGIKEMIGFPNPNVIRYHKYYDDVENCKYEIEQNILRLGYLPKRNDLRKPPLKGNSSLLGVYEKWGVGEFEKGGKFYTTIQKSLIILDNGKRV